MIQSLPRVPSGPENINLACYRCSTDVGALVLWLERSPAVRLFTGPQGRGSDHTGHKTQLHKHRQGARLQRTEPTTAGLMDHFGNRDDIKM